MSKQISHWDKMSDADYSQMHRTISGAYAIDIDQVEWRADRGIVAIICTTGNLNDKYHILNAKPRIWERTKFERMIATEIASKLNVPAFYVIHTKDLSCFHVHNLANISEFTELSQESYKIWVSIL
jgi:hypothetical protein